MLLRTRKTDGPGRAVSGLRQKSNSIQGTGKGIANTAKEMLPVESTHLYILKHGQTEETLYHNDIYWQILKTWILNL